MKKIIIWFFVALSLLAVCGFLFLFLRHQDSILTSSPGNGSGGVFPSVTSLGDR